MSINSYLKQSYPIPSQNWKKIAIIGLSIGLVMLIMQPFGLSEIKLPHKTIFLLGYGLVTFLVLFINLNFVIKLFTEYNWNIKRQILWSCWLIFTLGLANYAYTNLFGNLYPLSFNALIIFQVYTLIIGVVPICFLILLRQNQLLQQNETGAKILSENLVNDVGNDLNEIISIVADNGKDRIDIAIDDLAYIESIGNYIHVYYLLNGTMNQKILRSSISKAESETSKYKNLIKCHRAFIVNLNFIESVKGNAQGYRLAIKNSNRAVHVSRQYTKVLKNVFV